LVRHSLAALPARTILSLLVTNLKPIAPNFIGATTDHEASASKCRVMQR